MSRADVDTEILKPMQIMFLPPRDLTDAELRLALDGYVAVLQGFDAATLRAAWLDVVAAHKTRAWPVPGVIAVTAFRVRKDRAPRANVSHSAAEADREKFWKVVRREGPARQAAAMGVSWAFKCAVINDNKRPVDIDLKRLPAAQRSAAATADRIAMDLPLRRDGRDIGIMRGTLKDRATAMWLTLQLREAETQEEILHATHGHAWPVDIIPAHTNEVEHVA